ncbi:MAG: tRNA 2-thiouridine(34) synthase MnmA, partial [Candidatus Nealsonbacteria bacterium RIFCSPLOWO2_12_FULL_39_31]
MKIESKQPYASSLRGRHKQTNTPLKRKVFVAMSGGVDSSVAALLLQKSGFNLVGCYIKGWYPPGVICNWKEDRRDAMRVCAKLGMPFITVDAEKEYKKEVVDYMISEYKAGRTPNPDIMCNKSVKFGVFLKKALAMGADYIATGHYARLRLKIKNKKSNLKTYELAIAKDLNKDQSYFLWTLTQEQLKYCLFPLGGLLKSEVRKIAKKNDLATAEKEESQGVCFIGEFNMEDFLKKYIKQKKGKVV